MIKYYSKLQPPRAKRWSSFLVLLLVSPFLMWFIILLFGLCPCQLYNSLTPTHHSPSVRSYSQECGACSLQVPCLPSAQERNGARITAAKPSSPRMNDFHLLTLILMPSLKKSRLLMISMACLNFLGNVPDDYSVLHRGGSLPLSGGAPEHESSFYFRPISIFLNRSIYKRWEEDSNQLVRFNPTVVSYKL